MIDRSHIEKILQVNGMTSAQPDAVIRSVLLSARYDKDEIDTAIMVLREDADSNKLRVEGLHKVFRSDDSLQPKEISQLLGIQVDASQYISHADTNNRIKMTTFFSVWICSVVFAAVGVLLFMHVNSVGIFHPSML